MSLKYDFDMLSMYPDDVQTAFGAPVSNAKDKSMGNKFVAMFRDPALVKALRNADGDIQQAFTEAGFALNVYDSGAPSGRYPADHEAVRTYCIEHLTENLRKLPKNETRNWNGFDMAAFTQSIVKATPIEVKPRPIREPEDALMAHEDLIVARNAAQRKRPQTARIAALFGLAMGGALLLLSLASVVV